MPQEPARKKRRPQRREQILAAAVRLFHERGYHATGMDEIGAAAGITGPGVYRHFRNKEEILETLVRERGESMLAEVDRITVERPRARPRPLDALAHSYVEEIVEQPQPLRGRDVRAPHAQPGHPHVDRPDGAPQPRAVGRRSSAGCAPTSPRPRPGVVVHAALSLGVAICNYKSGLDDASLVALMHPMVMTAVLGPPPAAAGPPTQGSLSRLTAWRGAGSPSPWPAGAPPSRPAASPAS